MKYTNESGRSMVEMLGVLAIIGVLSVGGIAGYSKAMNKFKINKTTDQVSMLVANIRTLFSAQGDYNGLDNKAAKQFGIVPNDMYDSASDNTINNAFGGNVSIGPSGLVVTTGANIDTKAFIIEYTGLSQEACVTIATGDWGSGQASGLVGIAAAVSTEASGEGENATPASSAATLLADVDVGHAGKDNGAAGGVATPGGTYPTPMAVSKALSYCTSTSNKNSVAWKYY